MAGNLGQTRLRTRRRREDPMREFDRLPPVLRAWLSQAALPWRPRSVRRAYDRALAECGEPDAALRELERLEAARLAQAESPLIRTDRRHP
ncbi:MAG: DUF6525 family protein [Paracoccaceae bacterium]|nr:DUF6525 family protein [Paracoccaceae bacterium]